MPVTSRSVSDDRRRFITGALVGLVAARLPAALAADLPHLDESDPTAVALGYKNDAAQVDTTKSPQYKPDQLCSACRYFQGKADEWGPCLIFPGKAVHSKGWCSAFAAK